MCTFWASYLQICRGHSTASDVESGTCLSQYVWGKPNHNAQSEEEYLLLANIRTGDRHCPTDQHQTAALAMSV